MFRRDGSPHQWDPESHSPSFGDQQVPSGPPQVHLVSQLLAGLLDEQDGDSALQRSGAQSGARHQQLAAHPI